MGASKPKSKAASLAQCRRVLNALPFTSDWHADDIAALAPLARVRDYVAGSTLFYEDDEPNAVYFIERGAVEVFKSDGTGKKLPLIILRDSGVVGEMGLLSNEPRTATVRTLCAVRAVYMESDKINAALNEGSIAAYKLALGFARILSQRLAVVDRKLFELCEKDKAVSPTMSLGELGHGAAQAW